MSSSLTGSTSTFKRESSGSGDTVHIIKEEEDGEIVDLTSYESSDDDSTQAEDSQMTSISPDIDSTRPALRNRSPAGRERTEHQIVCDPPLPCPALYVQLQAWVSHHKDLRISVVPCAYLQKPNIFDDSGTSQKLWKHKVTGEVLQASVHELRGCGDTPKWVLVVRGESQGPYFIKGCRGGDRKGKDRDRRQIQRYRVWIFTQEKDGDGWEQNRSIFRTSEAVTEVYLHNHRKTPTNAVSETVLNKHQDISHASDNASAGQSVERRRSITTLRFAKRVLEDEHDSASDTACQPSRKKVRPAPRALSVHDENRDNAELQQSRPAEEHDTEQATQERALDANSAQGDMPHSHFDNTSSVVAETAQESHIAPSPAKSSEEAVIKHIAQHVKLHFYYGSCREPRMRTFAECNDIQELFGQAWAGGLFSESVKKGARLLSVSLDGKGVARRLMENDVPDFEAFLKDLIAADCWQLDGDQVSGELTVEVHAD